MHVSQTAEYALRAMAWLVVQGEGASVRAQDMSAATDIPLPYLSKIMRRLVVAGLLVSQKGHHGGFVLARPAKSIRFEEVLRACDYEPDPDACAFGWAHCDPAKPCPLHPAWAALKHAYADWAAHTTLADLAPPTSVDPARASKRARPSARTSTKERSPASTRVLRTPRKSRPGARP